MEDNGEAVTCDQEASDIGDLEIWPLTWVTAVQRVSHVKIFVKSIKHQTSRKVWGIKICSHIKYLCKGVRCILYLSVIFHLIHDSRERFVMSFLSAELVYAKCFYDSSSIIYIFSGDI